MKNIAVEPIQYNTRGALCWVVTDNRISTPDSS